ncbi:unnamed protein product [Acanthoscelides obtectus]|uniref:Uncharacterized protein n=1 Tax=Acanthoscelides obtectus TaxID=200917 RepID=A0A9P0JUS2_ACAOB|nr:unnamed protein product [Acanthoscelides obtectus]CAK1621911.1 hypothetical protein AOBTE_LOCUS1212 [Acanthoscelides obtectus]
MVADHGPFKYIAEKIRKDEQDPPKPNSIYLESYLRQHDEDTPRLYLRKIHGQGSLNEIKEGGKIPYFKPVEDTDGIYTYESEGDETEVEKDEDDFEIRSFVDPEDLEAIRKYRDTSFIIVDPQVDPRVVQLVSCGRRRRNKRIQADIQGIDVIYTVKEPQSQIVRQSDVLLQSEVAPLLKAASRSEVIPHSAVPEFGIVPPEVVDESLDDIVKQKHREEANLRRKLKVDAWAGKGIKRICLCDIKKSKTVKGTCGNKSLKIKLSVNRKTSDAVEAKQKKKNCLCNLTKKIIQTSAELNVENGDGLAQTLVGILEHKICICRKRKRNMLVKVMKKIYASSADTQTEVVESKDQYQNELEVYESERDKEENKIGVAGFRDKTNKDVGYLDNTDALHRGRNQKEVKPADEIPKSLEHRIQDALQEMQTEGVKVDTGYKIGTKESCNRNKQVCICNKKIKNVAIEITKSTTARWTVGTGVKEEGELDRSYVEIKLLGIEYQGKSQRGSIISKRKKRVCLSKKRLKNVAIRITKTSDPSTLKILQVFAGPRSTDMKGLKYKFGKEKKKRTCFCDLPLDSIDEEIITPLERIDGNIGQSETNIKETKVNKTLEVQPKSSEGSDVVREDYQRKSLETETSKGTLQEVVMIPDNGSQKSPKNSLNTEGVAEDTQNTSTSSEGSSKGGFHPVISSRERTTPDLIDIIVTTKGPFGSQEVFQASDLGTKGTKNSLQEILKPSGGPQANNLTTGIEDGTKDERESERTEEESAVNEKSPSSRTVEIYYGDRKMDKTQPTNQKSCLSKGHKARNKLISADNLGRIQHEKVLHELKLGSGSEVKDVSSVGISKQKKTVCFCDEAMESELLEKTVELPSNVGGVNINDVTPNILNSQNEDEDSKKKRVRPRNSRRKWKNKRDAEENGENEVAIREKYVAEFSYEEYQEIQGFVDEILEGILVRLQQRHTTEENKNLVMLTHKNCNQLSSNAKGHASIRVDDKKVKQKKKTCRCDCSCPETAFCNRPSLIGLLGSDELLSACIEKECDMPDAKKCRKDTECRDLNSSELMPIREESKKGAINANPNKTIGGDIDIKTYDRSRSNRRESGRNETSTIIGGCYKSTICNRVGSIVLFDSNKHLTQRTPEKTGINTFSEGKCQDTQTQESSSDPLCSKLPLLSLLDSGVRVVSNEGNWSDVINEVSERMLGDRSDKSVLQDCIYEEVNSNTVTKVQSTGVSTSWNEPLTILFSLQCLHLVANKEKMRKPTGDGKISYITEDSKTDDLSRRKMSQERQTNNSVLGPEEYKQNSDISRGASSQDQKTQSATKHAIRGILKNSTSTQKRKEENTRNEEIFPNDSSLVRSPDPCEYSPQNAESTDDAVQKKVIEDQAGEGTSAEEKSRKSKHKRSAFEITGDENKSVGPFRSSKSRGKDQVRKKAAVVICHDPDNHLATCNDKTKTVREVGCSKNIDTKLSEQHTQTTSDQITYQQTKICESRLEDKNISYKSVTRDSRKRMIQREIETRYKKIRTLTAELGSKTTNATKLKSVIDPHNASVLYDERAEETEKPIKNAENHSNKCSRSNATICKRTSIIDSDIDLIPSTKRIKKSRNLGAGTLNQRTRTSKIKLANQSSEEIRSNLLSVDDGDWKTLNDSSSLAPRVSKNQIVASIAKVNVTPDTKIKNSAEETSDQSRNTRKTNLEVMKFKTASRIINTSSWSDIDDSEHLTLTEESFGIAATQPKSKGTEQRNSTSRSTGSCIEATICKRTSQIILLYTDEPLNSSTTRIKMYNAPYSGADTEEARSLSVKISDQGTLATPPEGHATHRLPIKNKQMSDQPERLYRRNHRSGERNTSHFTKISQDTQKVNANLVANANTESTKRRRSDQTRKVRIPGIITLSLTKVIDPGKLVAKINPGSRKFDTTQQKTMIKHTISIEGSSGTTTRKTSKLLREGKSKIKKFHRNTDSSNEGTVPKTTDVIALVEPKSAHGDINSDNRLSSRTGKLTQTSSISDESMTDGNRKSKKLNKSSSCCTEDAVLEKRSIMTTLDPESHFGSTSKRMKKIHRSAGSESIIKEYRHFGRKHPDQEIPTENTSQMQSNPKTASSKRKQKINSNCVERKEDSSHGTEKSSETCDATVAKPFLGQIKESIVSPDQNTQTKRTNFVSMLLATVFRNGKVLEQRLSSLKPAKNLLLRTEQVSTRLETIYVNGDMVEDEAFVDYNKTKQKRCHNKRTNICLTHDEKRLNHFRRSNKRI